jgi:hypothetical protein
MMIKMKAGLAAGAVTAACLWFACAPAARAQYSGYYGYPNYSPYQGYTGPGYQYNGTEDPAFGYAPQGSSAHPFGPDPGGGSQHEGRSGVYHID